MAQSLQPKEVLSQKSARFESDKEVSEPLLEQLASLGRMRWRATYDMIVHSASFRRRREQEE